MKQNLVNLCLDAIARNFERHNLLFNITQDDYVKRNFDFLQRRYSSKLLSRVSHRGVLTDKFIDLLVNKYLTVLKTDWFERCSWHKITSKIAEIGCNIEEIFFEEVHSLWSSGIKIPWQDIVCYLPNLKSLNMHRSYQSEFCNVSDSILQNIARFCPEIEEIDIFNVNFKAESVKYLCKNENKDGKAVCHKLKTFCIGNTPSSINDLKYLLENLPSLKIIYYPDLPSVLYSLHKKDLSTLDKVKPYDISRLDLQGYESHAFYLDIRKICLYLCSHLKSLTCHLVHNDDLNFPHLSDLEDLHIMNFSGSTMNLNNLLKSVGGKLVSLIVVNCELSISVLAESCPHIKELFLTGVHFHHADDDSKPAFNSLSFCELKKMDESTSVGAIASLLSSQKLKSLNFTDCQLSSEMKAHILKCCELPSLENITINHTKIEKEFIKNILLNCHSLKCFSIDYYFERNVVDELLKFAKILPNKPILRIIDSYAAWGSGELAHMMHEDLDYDYE